VRAAGPARAAAALELVDGCHAPLHEQRLQVERTLVSLRLMTGAAADSPLALDLHQPHQRGPRSLRIGEAARDVGVRVSSLHSWEAQGVLRPARDRESGYRLYARTQLARLRAVKVLRDASYSFDLIRATLDELGAGRPEVALTAIEQRREALIRARQQCACATAAFWSYVSEASGRMHGE